MADEEDVPSLEDATDSEDGFAKWPDTGQASQISVSSVAMVKPNNGSTDILSRAIDDQITVLSRSHFKQPWEGYFLDLLPSAFPESVETWNPSKTCNSFGGVWELVVPAQTTLRQQAGALMTSAVKRLHATPWPQQQAAAKEKAFRRWRMVVEENLATTSLGVNLHKLAVQGEPDSEIAVLIADTFGDKKASTLNKRSGSILKYLMWHRRQYGTAGLPLLEDRCYKFIKTELQAPTAGKSFVSAVRFSHFTLKMQGAAEVLDSGRIKGATFTLFTNKRHLRQRRPYLVIEVLAFEAIAEKSRCPYERYFCFFVLLQTYSRARFNDISREKSLIADLLEDGSGYIEVLVTTGKTQRSAEARTTFLPTVAPAVGVSQFRWARAFVEERKAQGLESYCLMPTPAVQGGWHDSPLETTAANKWIRDILIAAGFTNMENVGTHSCKVTGLSWASKYGMDLQSRTLLGYHLLKEFGSTITYSRDALAEPLRKFDLVLKHIRMRTFMPDVTRSGRKVSEVTKRAKTAENPSMPGSSTAEPVLEQDGYEIVNWPDTQLPAVETDHEETSDVTATSNSDDSSSDSSCNGLETDSLAVQALAKVRPKIPADVEGKIPYYHPSSCFLHFRSQEQSKLRCGKALTSTYVKVTWDKAVGLINCSRCFRCG